MAAILFPEWNALLLQCSGIVFSLACPHLLEEREEQVSKCEDWESVS